VVIDPITAVVAAKKPDANEIRDGATDVRSVGAPKALANLVSHDVHPSPFLQCRSVISDTLTLALVKCHDGTLGVHIEARWLPARYW
jgi:hypothetical protein